jgi:hypothetical protein
MLKEVLMSDSQTGRPDLYDDFVPAFLDFIRHHRGRRTTHQVENGLDKFFKWLTTSQISDLQSLTATHIRDFMPSLGSYRPATIAVHASGPGSGLENVQGSFRSLSVGRRQARTCVRLRKEPIELNRALWGLYQGEDAGGRRSSKILRELGSQHGRSCREDISGKVQETSLGADLPS